MSQTKHETFINVSLNNKGNSLPFCGHIVYNMVMGTLTAVEPQKKKRSRVNLFIDGRFYCGLEDITFARSGLQEGDEVDEARLLVLIEESESSAAFEKAVKLVSLRPRTRAEVAAYLKEKGYPAPVAGSVIDKLAEYRFVDDAEFCRCYIRAKSGRLGMMRIKQELKQRGVDMHTIDDALEEFEFDETAAAIKAAEKYVRSHTDADGKKLMRHLSARGFTFDAVKIAAGRTVVDDDTDCFDE